MSPVRRLGYQVPGQAHLAMERGEVDGIGIYNWAAVRRDADAGQVRDFGKERDAEVPLAR